MEGRRNPVPVRRGLVARAPFASGWAVRPSRSHPPRSHPPRSHPPRSHPRRAGEPDAGRRPHLGSTRTGWMPARVTLKTTDLCASRPTSKFSGGAKRGASQPAPRGSFRIFVVESGWAYEHRALRGTTPAVSRFACSWGRLHHPSRADRPVQGRSASDAGRTRRPATGRRRASDWRQCAMSKALRQPHEGSRKLRGQGLAQRLPRDGSRQLSSAVALRPSPHTPVRSRLLAVLAAPRSDRPHSGVLD